MPHVSASRLLLAPREDVWDFIAEPHHFPDWWPGIAGVQPDRRGVAEGARWEILGHDRPTGAEPCHGRGLEDPYPAIEQDAPQAAGQPGGLDRRGVGQEHPPTLVVEAPWLYGFSRALPRRALTRLHALCQTAAEL